MSFRRFIYYSTLIGAWTAFLGWAMGRSASAFFPRIDVLFYTIFLGMAVAFGLSLVDALWNFSASQVVSIFARVGTAVAIALIASSACGGLGSFAFNSSTEHLGRSIGIGIFILVWIGLGLLIGLSIGVFELFAGLARKDTRAPINKLIKCGVGGTVGGVLGGIFAAILRFVIGPLLHDPGGNELWCPTAVGFVILGGLIGLLVGLSQVFLLEAWVKVEAGFRPGRDLVLSRHRTTIGRGEGSDIPLFGDNGVEKQHAQIVLDKGGYFLEPLPNTPGTYVNEIPITARTPLKAGDQIRVGNSLLRFNQRRKK